MGIQKTVRTHEDVQQVVMCKVGRFEDSTLTNSIASDTHLKTSFTYAPNNSQGSSGLSGFDKILTLVDWTTE